MLIEAVIILINTVLTIVFLKFTYKALRIKSRCNKFCDIELETEE